MIPPGTDIEVTMKVPQVKYVKFRSTRNFGIELEVNEKINANELVRAVSAADPDRSVIQSGQYEQDFDNDYWHVKFDRSCGDVKNHGGWEVASYKASGHEDLSKMGLIADAMKKAGALVNEECGFHIHAEVADFHPEQVATLVAYWLKIEPIILEILPRHRRNNKYARPMTKFYSLDNSKLYTAKQFWDLVRPKRFDVSDRRVALNLCNYAQHTTERLTVELRLPECVLDGKEVKNWVRFYLHFVDFVKKKEFPKNIGEVNLYETMKIVGLHNENPFFLLSRGLRETKIWLAKRILTYSVKKKTRQEAETFLNALEVKKPHKIELESTKLPERIGWWKPYSHAENF